MLGWYRRADGGEDLLLLGVRRGGLGDGEPGVLHGDALDARELGEGGGRGDLEPGLFQPVVGEASWVR